MGDLVEAGKRAQSPPLASQVPDREGSDDDDYDEIAEVDKLIGAPPGAFAEMRLVDRVADVLVVGRVAVPEEPGTIVQSVNNVVTEWRDLRAGRNRHQAEVDHLRRRVARLRAANAASQAQVEEIRGVARAFVPGAAVSNSIDRLRAGVGSVVAAGVEGVVVRFG